MLVAAILLVSERLSPTAEDTNVRIAGLGALSGLLLLVRPQQASLPAMLALTHLGVVRRAPRRWLPGALAAVLFIALAVAFQVWVNGVTTGIYRFNLYASGGEDFNWLHPQWYTVLASAGRGLLIYSPIVVLALAGIVRDPRFNRVALAMAGHALIQIWLIAAWSSPAQGDAFGARMWVECMPLVALGLASLFDAARSTRARAVVVGAALACTAWTGLLMVVHMTAPIAPDISFAELFGRIARLFGAAA
jgi:hypothetical protein